MAAAVTSVWAATVRESGRIPLYSTGWTNGASLIVAPKLSLSRYGDWWSVASA